MATQWDSVNKKKVYGGKYSQGTQRGQGYFGRNTAGNPQEFVTRDWGTEREFVGSRTQEYTFSDKIHGTHTFTAISYKDALRQAEAEGYTASDYIDDKRRRRGKR